MQVIEVSAYGGPEVLREVTRPDPAAAPGKVRVRLAATTVNPADLWTRQGAMAARTPDVTPPIVLGWEFTGTVLDPAPGFEVGQAVAGLYPWFAGGGTGTYQTVVVAEPGWLAPLPAGADPVEAATVAMNAQTARQALRLVSPAPGETVVVTGASGAVGGFAVQLAAAAGAHVIAVASTGDEEWVASLGAKEVLSRRPNEEVAAAVRALYPDGVDVAVDASAGGPALIGAVRDHGRYAAVTDPVEPPAERGIRPVTVHTEPDASELAELLDAWAAGRLRTRVAGVVPLSDAAGAHRRVAEGGLRGKLVLVP